MDFLNELISLENLDNLLNYNGYIYLVISLVLFWIGKIIYDFLTPFKVNKELTTNDNKALSVSFCGYLVAIGIIIWGVLDSPNAGFAAKEKFNLLFDIRQITIWSLVGIVLLNIARLINDKILLGKFDNTKEIIKDKNVGTGAVEFGSYVGTAFIIRSLVTGETSVDFSYEILATIVFFILGQIAFILFGFFYQKMTKYDLYDEIEKDNIAAGLAYGLSLVAIGILLSEPLKTYDSLVYLGIWLVMGMILIYICRLIVDKLIFPEQKIDDEISKDRNWGVALIEGGLNIVIVLILSYSF